MCLFINLMEKKYFFLMIGICLISLVSAEQILWDNDTNIEIYDTWEDVDGTLLTGATCTWYVYNPIGTLNQSGVPNELTEGVLNFTVNRLEIGIYPMIINCTKGGYYGASSLNTIKIIDELSEEYKDRLVEINQTTKDIYNLLVDDINVTLTSILNLTNLTYEKVVDIESDISDLDDCCSSLTTYLETKWGNDDADEIIDRIKDIRSDVTYLKSRYNSVSEKEKDAILLLIREDSRAILDLVYDKDKWWGNLYVLIIPLIVIVLLIILIKVGRKNKNE